MSNNELNRHFKNTTENECEHINAEAEPVTSVGYKERKHRRGQMKFCHKEISA
jgi:hypothetical protein